MKVYTYGIMGRRQPDEAVAIEQMRRAAAHYNQLVAIERRRRLLVDVVSTEGLADLVADMEAADELAAEATKAKDKPALREARSLVREARSALTAAKRETRAQRRDRIAAINAAAIAAGKIARAECGCYWGTYLLAEQAAEQAAKAAMKQGSLPRFRRWAGSGAVGIQLQGGAPVTEIVSAPGEDLSTDTRMRIQVHAPTGTSRRAQLRPHATVWWRLGSVGRDPLWWRVEIRMHRPIPEEGRIKRAQILRRLDGGIPRWELQITVDTAPARRPHGGRDAAVNLGWRRTDAGLRVATLVDDDGTIEHLHLPPEILGRLERSESLRAIRDRAMDELKARVLALLDGADDVPAWLAERRRYMAQWRSPRRWVRLLRDAEACDSRIATRVGFDLIPWAAQDNHLWQWETRNRRRAILHRREVYRVWAAGVAERHRRIAIEDVDRSRVAVSARDDLGPGPARYRVVAAPYVLVEALANALGPRLVRVPSAEISMTCPTHGVVEDWDRSALDHTWPCGCTWDQDVAAGEVMLGRLPEWSGGDEDGAAFEGRWQRRAREAGGGE